MKKQLLLSPEGIELVEVNHEVSSQSVRYDINALHQHEQMLQLLYIYSGEGCYRVGERIYAVHEGELVICNANMPHGIKVFSEGTIETYGITLTGVCVPGQPEDCLVLPGYRPVIQLERFQETMRAMLPDLYELYVREERELGTQLAVSFVMMTCKQLQMQEQTGRSDTIQHTETMVREITACLDANYAAGIRMEELCDTFHLSVSYLSHMFKQQTGFSPKQYIILKKVSEAQRLLAETNIPISDIEKQLGFGSSSHLSSIFKKHVGISPREYRKNYRKSKRKR